MKTKWVGLCAVSLLVATPVARAGSNELSATLQRGLFEEEANHNLEAAIQAYQRVISEYDTERKLAATAVFRLGESYRKQGKTNEASAQYERVVREFSDEEPLPGLSRQSLLALGRQPPSASMSNLAEAAMAKAQLTRLMKLDPAERRVAIQQEFPNPVLTSLMERLQEAEQKLAAVQKDYGPENPEVLKARAVQETVIKQVDAQVKQVLENLAFQQSSFESRRGEGAEPGTQGPTNIQTADEADEVKRIQAMIKDSPDLINAKDPGTGSTPLHRAAFAGQLVVATFLLNNGADIEAQDHLGQTPLHHAARSGHKSMVELLLNRKAHAQAADQNGYTSLHLAAEHGFRSVVEVLLANGAEVNAKTKEGVTALHLAVANGAASVAALLLERGADPNVIASQFNSEGANYNGAPLNIAAERNDVELATLLLEKKADINSLDNRGETPLHIAARKGSVPVATLLLARGAPVDAKMQAAQPGASGHTPLTLAVGNGLKEMVALLLQHKADPDAKFMATLANPNSMVAPSDNVLRTVTPLIWAAYKSYSEIVDLLLAAKADPNLKSDNNISPLFEAVLSSVPSTGRQLATSLLEHGADVNSGQDAVTPLMQAVFRNELEVVEVLLAHKADVNAKDKSDRSALHYAMLALGHGTDIAPLVQLLINAGADVNARDNRGQTPLKYILGNERPAYTAMAALLRQHGALDDVPRPEVIQVRRPSANFSRDTFASSSNQWNQFSLLESIAAAYNLLVATPDGAPYYQQQQEIWAQEHQALAYPDFSRVHLRRPTSDLKSWTERTVDLSPILDSGDCSQDQPLSGGDVVEVPEAEHALNERWKGFSPDQFSNLKKCLSREVIIIVKGQATTNSLAPAIDVPAAGIKVFGVPVSIRTGTSFWLKSVLLNSHRVLTSSDLSQVKVTRQDRQTGAKAEWVLDCSEGKPAPAFWLRDGDVIEVPDKARAER